MMTTYYIDSVIGTEKDTVKNLQLHDIGYIYPYTESDSGGILHI